MARKRSVFARFCMALLLGVLPSCQTVKQIPDKSMKAAESVGSWFQGIGKGVQGELKAMQLPDYVDPYVGSMIQVTLDKSELAGIRLSEEQKNNLRIIAEEYGEMSENEFRIERKQVMNLMDKYREEMNSIEASRRKLEKEFNSLSSKFLSKEEDEELKLNISNLYSRHREIADKYNAEVQKFNPMNNAAHLVDRVMEEIEKKKGLREEALPRLKREPKTGWAGEGEQRKRALRPR